jgi:hypothetical protein
LSLLWFQSSRLVFERSLVAKDIYSLDTVLLAVSDAQNRPDSSPLPHCIALHPLSRFFRASSPSSHIISERTWGRCSLGDVINTRVPISKGPFQEGTGRFRSPNFKVAGPGPAFCKIPMRSPASLRLASPEVYPHMQPVPSLSRSLQ